MSSHLRERTWSTRWATCRLRSHIARCWLSTRYAQQWNKHNTKQFTRLAATIHTRGKKFHPQYSFGRIQRTLDWLALWRHHRERCRTLCRIDPRLLTRRRKQDRHLVIRVDQ